MEMTDCKWYGVDCSECDDRDGVPDCFTPKDQCRNCGRTLSLGDAFCPCEQGE